MIQPQCVPFEFSNPRPKKIQSGQGSAFGPHELEREPKRRKTNDGAAAWSLPDGSVIEIRHKNAGEDTSDDNSGELLTSNNNYVSGNSDIDRDTDIDSGSDSDNACPESFFDISIDRPFCSTRMDTQLVLIDIPGINDADPSNKYKDYIRSNWRSFDCGQLESLLKFVNENKANLKDVPTIVLCNKVDDPDSAETQVIVQNHRDTATKIFGSGCSDKLFGELLHTAKNFEYDPQKTKLPVFVPISAMTAFIFRDAKYLTVDNFHKLDNDVMDKIGRDEVGRKWKKMTTQEKLNTFQKVISNPDEYNERLADTNFDKFLLILEYFIGGHRAQRALLTSQVDVALKALTERCHLTSIVDAIHQIFKKAKVIERSTDDLKGVFWKIYEDWEDDAIRKVEKEVEPKFLQRPLTELERYHELAVALKWEGEPAIALNRMKTLIRRFFRMTHTRIKTWSILGFLNQCRQRERYDKVLIWKRPDKLLWSNLSPHDWITILFSLSLASRNIAFCESFGRELNWIEEFLLHFRSHFSPYLMIAVLLKENTIKGHDPDICAVYKYIAALKRVKDDPGKKNAIFKIKMPEEMSDPCHWGHCVWKYIQLMSKTKPEYREKEIQENSKHATTQSSALAQHTCSHDGY
eukprot:jgi/Psemu1/54202/gm1.54202_g